MRGISKPQQINIEIILTLILVLLQLFHIFTVILSTSHSVSIKNEAMYYIWQTCCLISTLYNVVFKGRNIKSNEFTEELLVYLSLRRIHMKNNYGTPNCKHNESMALQ